MTNLYDGSPAAGNPSASHNSKDQKVELPSRVAQWYYKHGLFLSTYPTCAASIAIAVVLLSCYPLLNIPLPGTIPTKVILPYSQASQMEIFTKQFTQHHYQQQQQQEYLSKSSVGDDNNSTLLGEDRNESTNLPKNLFTLNNLTIEPPFPWAHSQPFIYVQQIIFRTSVAPWQDNLYLTDAYRGPLNEIFKLLEIVRNHEDNMSRNTLAHICLHVENVKRSTKESIFPEYNCLVLSPANFWQQSASNFNKDTNLLNTIFQHHNLQKTKVSTAEMLFGMSLQDAGVKRYPIRIRPRIIQYAITIVLREYDQLFINSLRQKLHTLYPLHQETQAAEPEATKGDDRGDNASEPIIEEHDKTIMYIYYPGEFNVLEFMPLCIAFLILFFYVYFSVRKIDVIRSRFVLASCAVITVLSSLMMSLGLCFFFGLTMSMQSKGVFQYLVILVGLENVLVLTKSVITTDDTFDVKIRLAQGLSKEGWSISKTLLTEITILTIGLATFVPVIQEFCIFAIVGLISDFFLQMMLFSTVLALDIKRIEFSNLHKNGQTTADGRRQPFRTSTITSSFTINRSRSHPKLTAFDAQSDGLLGNSVPGKFPNSGVGGSKNTGSKIPKRLRIFNLWARTRFFQRAFMLWMIVWISSIIHNSQVFEQFFFPQTNVTNNPDHGSPLSASQNIEKIIESATNFLKPNNPNERGSILPPEVSTFFDNNRQFADEGPFNLTEQLLKLKHPNVETTFHLSNFHWSSILKQYNISMSGKYVTILPAIRLSYAVPPEVAVHIRNLDEKPMQQFQWKALAVALDPIDFNDLDTNEQPDIVQQPGTTPLYPKSPMEILLASILCAISVFVLTYTMVIFYRCVCSRNYAEWRASWNDTDIIYPQRQRVLEGVPIQVMGHTHQIECLVTDGTVVTSSCLEGQVKIWDANNGELISNIDRKRYFHINRKMSAGPAERISFGGCVDRPVNNMNSDGLMLNNNNIQKKPSFSLGGGGSGGDGFVIFNRQQISTKLKESTCSPIWCLDYVDNLIVIGCADGRIEFWEGSTGNLKCIYESEGKHRHGITNIHLAGNRVIAARLSGRIDFLKLETYNQGRQIDWGFTSAYRRTHVRTGSTGSLSNFNAGIIGLNPNEELRCMLEHQHQGHQQPITCMDIVGGTVFTGSQDHTLKVFKLDIGNLLYTLHGHCGPITCLFIDHYQSDTGGSGSQDGLLCVWELLTGACMYSIQAHDGAIVALACAPSYVISVGADERLCVWERFQGHLLNTINISHIYTSLLMLTPSLLVTGKPGSLIVWDVRSGEATREVKLDCVNFQLCPKILLPANGSVICDYGNEIRIVRFPLVTDKCE